MMSSLQVFELVKNSLRAVNDKYQDSDDLPPSIRVVVAEGGEDVTIKVGRIPSACCRVCLAWNGHRRWPSVLIRWHPKALACI
jgi:hypothetical protein